MHKKEIEDVVRKEVDKKVMKAMNRVLESCHDEGCKPVSHGDLFNILHSMMLN